jgi:hypothetical protein
MSVLFFLDGVLRKPEDKSPILEGVKLYKAMNDAVLTRLIVADRPEAERWMKIHNMAKKIDDLVVDSHPGPENEDFRKVQYCRSQGKIDYVVTADVELAKLLLEDGITTYLFLSPKYMRPEFRPDSRTGVRSWTEIEEEIYRQRDLFNNDPRVS